jgi:hypothetical protein
VPPQLAALAFQGFDALGGGGQLLLAQRQLSAGAGGRGGSLAAAGGCRCLVLGPLARLALKLSCLIA